MLRQFLVRHYKIIFQTKLLDGFIFLLLFLTGLARYRVALVFVAIGFFSAINQYYLDQKLKTQITYYYELLKRVFVPVILVALLFDINNGQIFSVYPTLPFLMTILCVVVGYGFSLIFYIKARYLVQWLSKDEIFTVCPNCSFENIMLVQKCDNCGYTKGSPLEKHEECKEQMPVELQGELRLFKNMGMYRRAPKEVIRALKLEKNEYILSIMNSSVFYFIGVRKNDERMRPGWFVLTNKKIICYYGRKGWTGREFIPYQDMKHVGVIMDWAGYRKNRFLEIEIKSDSFKFLFGSTTKNLLKRIMFFEADNKLTLDNILRSISKRLPAIAGALAANGS